MTINLIKELQWRGMLQDIMPGTEAYLLANPTLGYIGFDPTADSLHIGSLVPILLLVHLQRAGHTPVALVGGATGMIGDPSGKSEERNLLDEASLAKNITGIKNQLSKYLDFSQENKNAAILVNNYDWFKDISFISFLRDVGKYITVNYMMGKDSVKKRIEGTTGISYTEFAYQLMQGYDFYWLYANKGVQLQMGGSDQWGNITTGAELVRRKTAGEGTAFAFTCPLLTKADGGKFGKTESGNVWLDPNRTSPYQFYQFWLNASDEDAQKWIKIFTFLDENAIQAIIDNHQLAPSARALQQRLAKEITIFVHGEAEYAKAIETTKTLFTKANAPASALSIEDLETMEGVQKVSFSAEKLSAGQDVVSFLAETGIFPSKGEAKKSIQGGGVSINRSRIEGVDNQVNTTHLLHNRYILVQKGKKNYYLVEVK